MNVARFVAAMVVTMALLVACGSETPDAPESPSPKLDPPAPPAPESTAPKRPANAADAALPEGPDRFVDHKHGLSIRKPTGWVIDDTAGDMYALAMRTPGGPTRPDHWATMNILITDLQQPMSLKLFVQRRTMLMERQVPAFEFVASEWYEIDGRTINRSVYRGGEGPQRVTSVSYVTLHNDRAVMINFTTTPDSFAAFVDRFDNTADSLRLK